MKKFIASSVLAILVATFALVACQKKEEAPAPAPAPAVQQQSTSKAAPAPAPEKKQFFMIFSGGDFGSTPFFPYSNPL